MANHLEFGAISVGSPGAPVRIQEEIKDCVSGLRKARMIIGDYVDPNDVNDWAYRVDDILRRAIKQLNGAR